MARGFLELMGRAGTRTHFSQLLTSRPLHPLLDSLCWTEAQDKAAGPVPPHIPASHSVSAHSYYSRWCISCSRGIKLLQGFLTLNYFPDLQSNPLMSFASYTIS